MGQPHESPLVMWLPLVMLAVPTIFAGFLSYNNAFADFLTGGEITTPYVSPFAETLTYVSIGVAVVGILLAWAMYGLGVIPAKAIHWQSHRRADLPAAQQPLLHRRAVRTHHQVRRPRPLEGLRISSISTSSTASSTARRASCAAWAASPGARRPACCRTTARSLFGGALMLMIAVFFAVGVFR